MQASRRLLVNVVWKTAANRSIGPSMYEFPLPPWTMPYRRLQYHFIPIGFVCSVVTSLFESGAKPVKTLVQTITRSCACRLDELWDNVNNQANLPERIILPKHVDEENVDQVCQWFPRRSSHSVKDVRFRKDKSDELPLYRKILFVSEDEEKSVTEFVLIQHSLQLFLASMTRSRSLLSTTKMIPWVFWK